MTSTPETTHPTWFRTKCPDCAQQVFAYLKNDEEHTLIVIGGELHLQGCSAERVSEKETW